MGTDREQRLRTALENYMSAFGQALDKHDIEYGPQQEAADVEARAALAEATPEPPTPEPKQPNPCPTCGTPLWDDPRPCWHCARMEAAFHAELERPADRNAAEVMLDPPPFPVLERPAERCVWRSHGHSVVTRWFHTDCGLQISMPRSWPLADGGKCACGRTLSVEEDTHAGE